MAKKRYVICPGYVISRNDGQRKYIDAGALIHLYRVNPAECFIVGPYQSPRIQFGKDVGGLIFLHPRTDGRYWRR